MKARSYMTVLTRFCQYEVKDAAGLITKAENDYRLLRTRMVTDANGNRGCNHLHSVGIAGNGRHDG